MHTQTIPGAISTGPSADHSFETIGVGHSSTQSPVSTDLVTRALTTLLNRDPVDIDSAMLALLRQTDMPTGPSYPVPEATPATPVPLTAVAGSERREFPRRSSSGNLRFAAVPEALAPELAALQRLLRSRRARGSVIDISQTGVAFICESALQAGSHLSVSLPGTSGMEPMQVTAKVIRCQQIDQHDWKVVCQFLAPLTFEEAYAVGETPERPAASVFETPLY